MQQVIGQDERAGPRSVPDPGDARRRPLLWGVAIGLITLITLLQQCAVNAVRFGPEVVQAPKEGVVLPVGSEMDQADMATRIMVKLGKAMEEMGSGSESKSMYARQLSPLNQPTLEQGIKLVPGYTEIAGVEAGLSALKALDGMLTGEAAKVTPDREGEAKRFHALRIDVGLLERLYRDGSASLLDSERERLITRLGWPGRLAVTHDQPDSAERASLLANGGWLLTALVCLGLLIVLVAVAGLTMFIVAVVMLAQGKIKPRMDRPAPGGTLGLEVLVVFLGAFAGVKVVTGLIGSAIAAGWLGSWVNDHGEAVHLVVVLAAQWLILPLVMLYPLMRGHSRWRIKRALGWHRGAGFVREIGAGVAGYLALMPLYGLALVLALVLVFIEQTIVGLFTDKPPTGPVNPIGELVSQSWWMGLLIAMLAVIWAPLVEETVFRGGMFRHLYARMNLVVAALISGTVFAMMHGYSPALFPPLIVLGAGFAVLRWWRGSLVACVAAHALHNGTLMIVMLVLFNLLK